MCDVTHEVWCIDVWRDVFICDVTDSYVTWHISYMSHDLFMRDMTHVVWRIDAWRDMFICDMVYFYVTWRMHVTYEAWRIQVWRDSCGLLHAHCRVMLIHLCYPLQHTATHCNTLQHTANSAPPYNTLPHPATHCNTLQHNTAHCNTLPRNISLFYVIWLIPVWQNPFICDVTDRTHSYVTWQTEPIHMWRDTCVCHVETWLIQRWRETRKVSQNFAWFVFSIIFDNGIDVTHAYVILRHDSVKGDVTHSPVT